MQLLIAVGVNQLIKREVRLIARTYHNQQAIRWDELTQNGIEPSLRVTYRLCRLCPAMLTKIGHQSYIKLRDSNEYLEKYQLVTFDIEFVKHKVTEEILKPLGLNSFDELSQILESKESTTIASDK